MNRHNWIPTVAALSVTLTLTVAGCDSETVSDLTSKAKSAVEQGASQVSESANATLEQAGEAVEQAKQAASNAATTMTETVGAAGSMQFTVDTVDLQVSACYAKIISLPRYGVNVLQLQSYRDPTQETLPSAFIRAETAAGSLSELAGQTLSAQVYIAGETAETVWFTKDGPVELVVTSVDDDGLAAEISATRLYNAQTGQMDSLAATFEAVTNP